MLHSQHLTRWSSWGSPLISFRTAVTLSTANGLRLPTLTRRTTRRNASWWCVSPEDPLPFTSPAFIPLRDVADPLQDGPAHKMSDAEASGEAMLMQNVFPNGPEPSRDALLSVSAASPATPSHRRTDLRLSPLVAPHRQMVTSRCALDASCVL